jgi:hypothetical protein
MPGQGKLRAADGAKVGLHFDLCLRDGHVVVDVFQTPFEVEELAAQVFPWAAEVLRNGSAMSGQVVPLVDVENDRRPGGALALERGLQQPAMLGVGGHALFGDDNVNAFFGHKNLPSGLHARE